MQPLLVQCAEVGQDVGMLQDQTVHGKQHVYKQGGWEIMGSCTAVFVVLHAASKRINLISTCTNNGQECTLI